MNIGNNITIPIFGFKIHLLSSLRPWTTVNTIKSPFISRESECPQTIFWHKSLTTGHNL